MPRLRNWTMLSVGAAFAATLLAGGANAASCDQPKQMDGFKTCADVAKAEAEGAFVLYTTQPETNATQLLADFHKAFPKIATNFLRLQAGAQYAKILAERQAHTYQLDVTELTDMTFVTDFQKRGGYTQYVSPEMAAYKPDYKSNPEGFWNWTAMIVAGIAYNPNQVAAADAPKSWKDLLDPKWKGTISAKVSNSGLQHVTWYEIRNIYGEDYWKKFAELEPRAFDSYVQQFDRMVNGQDKIAATAQLSGYLQFKAKGAPVAFVYPTEGLTATPSVMGIADHAPHPEAAKLFMDWVLGVPGQKSFVAATSLYSPRVDVPAPEGAAPIAQQKILAPTDWEAFLKTHTAFVREWDKAMGMR